jgi:alpha-amylase
MCIKYSHDGDVHKYFSPYDSPYDAYLDHRSAVEAFERRCRELSREQAIAEQPQTGQIARMIPSANNVIQASLH